MSLKSLTILLKSIKNFAGFKKKYTQQYIELCKLTTFLPESSGVRQRVWHILNNTQEIPTCINYNCTNLVKWNTTKKRYNESCSVKCANNNISKINKIKQTTLEMYGNESYARTAEYASKRDATNLLRHGTTNPNTLPHIQKKRKNTLLSKYGVVVPLHHPDIKKKANQTNLELYGSVYPLDNIQVQEKRTNTIQNKFARNNNLQTHISIANLEKLNDYNWLYEQHITNKRTCVDIGNELGVYNTTVHSYLNKYNIIIHRYNTSFPEKELHELLCSWNIDFIINFRKIIPPYELDIYIPEHKLAIEYCGLYWHSDVHNRTDKHYHKRKHDLCKEQGIQLLTIFEDEWLQHQIPVIKKLQNILCNNNIRIYARKTNITEVSTKQKQEFFDTNHIQGNGPGSINIGLEYEGTLIACMSFIKQKEQHYLNRYATSCSVPGGFSKLLKYFQNNYEWNKLISFADLRWSNGNLYKKTGWKLDSILSPDYSYIKGTYRYHKFNYRRKHLPRLLNNFNPELSEKENCDNNGILRIWDCGKLRYVINNS